MADIIGDLLGGVCFAFFEAQCCHELLCFCCKAISEHCVEAVARFLCHCCCGITKVLLEICANSNSGLLCPNCSCPEVRCPGRWTCAAVCLCLLAIYCCVLGTLCFVAVYRFGSYECGEPLDTHVSVQGIAMFGNAFALMYICCTYYLPSSISIPFHEKTAFSRFHLLFSKHLLLAAIVGLACLGFWWSLFGYYWISKAVCPPEATFLLTMDHFVILNEFLLGLGFLFLIYSILSLAACDEGSCRFETYTQDCFVCCCGCCLTMPPEYEKKRWMYGRRSREFYPMGRLSCIGTSLGVAKACGCIRESDDDQLQEAIVQEPARSEYPEDFPPIAQPNAVVPEVVVVRIEDSCSSSEGDERKEAE